MNAVTQVITLAPLRGSIDACALIDMQEIAISLCRAASLLKSNKIDSPSLAWIKF